MKRCFVVIVAVLAFELSSFAGEATAPASTSSSVVPYLTPEDAVKTIELQPGYRLELVVGEPVIEAPALAVFDGNGRMYVSEMRSFMRDIDSNDQMAPVSRVSTHWSSKGDGNFDRHAIFADNLVLPRMILPLDGAVLINESGTDEIWSYRDTNGDGVSDEKKLFRPGGRRGENIEHQPSGLIWSVDNWLYMAVNPYRLRIRGTNQLVERTPGNYGQWGVSQDDYGKPWFVNAGLEAGPVNIEMPIIYGQSEMTEKVTPGFPEVWPLVGMGDYQGGLMRVRPADKTLNNITSACGPDIFRGDRLPLELRGDLLFSEPAGRLIRRAKVEVSEGLTTLRNPHEGDKSEFIRSRDPNFRPVNLVTAPDGTIYIVDMYRGIIQERAFITPYLRDIMQKSELEKNLGRGRIWRLAHRDFKPGPQPRLLDERPAQLVSRLEHPNGWWRDTAQKLLVLRSDKSVVPALARMARSSTNHLARVHAIWTLEGLEALEPLLVREKLKDRHPQVRVAAIRASETLYKAGERSLVPDILELRNDTDAYVVLQVLMSASHLKWPDSRSLAASVIATNSAKGVKLIAPGLAAAAPPPLPREFTEAEKTLLTRGEDIYKQLCFSCHGLDGKGTPVPGIAPGSKVASTMAPSLTGSKLVTGHRDGVINVVLKGLSGPVDGKNYTAVMTSMQGNDDEWIAAAVSFVRNSFGNNVSTIDTNDVARVRATFAQRAAPWTVEELATTLPPQLGDRRRWKVTASHNDASARLAIDDDSKTRYDTRAIQSPGTWFQIAFPDELAVSGLALDAGSSVHDYPRGYKVEISSDEKNWGEPVATGHGTGALTEIHFPQTKTRYVRITQTSSNPSYYWSIHDLHVYGAAPVLSPGILTKKAIPSIYE